ncbi:AAA family ATPase [Streptomyces sp. NPDC091292]|uniref:AAA family ATPase n=1 Tax=Streptomyces sp. NPDC091292 TaxID=3365991 RepID=UPI0037FA6A2F
MEHPAIARLRPRTRAPVLLRDRTHDFATMRTAMDRAQEGDTVLVTVTGAPGMGRSALLDTLAERAAKDGFVVRRARGSRLEQGLPLGVPSQLLPQAGLDAEVPVRVELASAVRRHAVVGEARAAQQAGAAAPVALLADDLQWADEASLTWLARLLADPRPAPLLLVVAVCEGEATAERPGVQDLLTAADHVMRTGALGEEDVGALLEEYGVLLTDTAIRAWTRATGGNPALITSLLDRVPTPHRLAPAGLLDLARALPAPWTLRARVAAALAGHPEPVRRFAHGVALLGGVAGTRVLARLADLDPAEETAAAHTLLRLGWAADRWSPPVLWDCVREIAEDALPLADRTRLHRRAAELLHETGAPAELIVPHLLEIGPGEWTDAASVLREAACDAWRRRDSAFAIRCLRRALREFPPDSPQRGDFLAALADAEQDADTSAMLRHVNQALPLLSSAGERAAVVACVPLTLFLSARQAASDVLDHIGPLPPAPADDPAAVELGLRLEARVRLFGLSDPAAPDAAVARLRALDPGPGPATAAERELVSVLTFAGALGGRLPSAEVAPLVRWMLEHEPASATSGYAAPALMIACAATASLADEPVRGWLDMALGTARQRGDERLETHVLGWRALTALHAGRLADAWSDALDVCATARGPLGDDDWMTVLALTSVVVETGDPWLADRLRVLLCEEQGTGMPVRDLALRVLRIPLTPEPELAALVADLLDAADRAESAGWWNRALFPVDLWCVPLLQRLGEPEVALGLLARACDRARGFGSPAVFGRILRIWGTALRGRYALSLLAESVAVLREGANALELGRSLTAYGNRLRAAGRPGAADVLAEADRIADATGESLLRCWTGPHRGEPRGADLLGGGLLSHTERRVAALVALGHTNQDAADALGVTRRAVEKILTRLYQRLDVEGRAGLIPVVRRMAGKAAFRSGALAGNL